MHRKIVRLFLKLREPFASGSHLSGSIAGIFGAVYLVLACNGSFSSITAVLVYSVAFIALFLVSGLLHGLHCSEKLSNQLERLDYAAIYLFIAGTYTPVCLFAIKGNLGLGILIGEWILALLGIWLVLTRGPSSRNIQICVFFGMGWAFLLALPSLSKALSPVAFTLLLLGGVSYSIGAVILALDWPKLFKARFSTHDLWHVLVLCGGGLHYAFVVQIVI